MLQQTVRVKNGAEWLIECLKKEAVEMIYGYPGGAVLPLYDALYESGVKHILARHEQGAIHAAEGYARITGKAGVVVVTSGPGATNVVTGLADALADSLPLVVITGQVATGVIGTDAFQEADVVNMTSPITKHSFQVRDAKDIPNIVKQAFYIAQTGRPGPVVIDLPKDMMIATVTEPAILSELENYQVPHQPNKVQIDAVATLLKTSKRPIILAGAGVNGAFAKDELTEFSNKTNIPVINTLLGLGNISPDSPLAFGMAGMHGNYAANRAIYECDVLLAIGARFDDRLVGAQEHFAAGAKIVHIDIDPSEIDKVFKATIGIVADAKAALIALNQLSINTADEGEWLERLQSYKVKHPLGYEASQNNVIKPQAVIEAISEETKGTAIVSTDVGQHQMWTAQFYKFKEERALISSGGLGTMGFGLPAAIGGQMANPDRMVVAIVGDGGFQMTLQELALLKEFNLNIKVFILNNASLGMVKQWQHQFYEQRYSESVFDGQPDFVKLAEAYGITGKRITQADKVATQVAAVFAIPGPVVVDVHINQTETVTPMVPPGKGIHQMEGVVGK
ncbi:acetolactate synthase, large subunit, biosynthetic type [Brochothrix thermosphacta]|uniref:biosynthetic-type acetolactate synthase large subunit n=1 Tax=Brochothrix thermosphacta TaxID=2756 RepID=UPI00083F7E35|nr:biosynthetic-type acetolactate synthase large subunit [Brochothrix thermosphacta]ODJ52658.1 acetolactate synthase, large subunit, biosynthetic type [Brochothrix thermosphacta]ODJ53492.1 acetolactate synthase, large subunit, biosynthetic type [Brochothrix thermosphacta]ODJ69246.1 acetolactate synthase, large subunit, biosynthetic type [Brochothrix thermosphacta]SPP26770.1 acetolactate synthase (acetohydroxy-acid synthase) (large subunit) [Brochothrix thermosphacta]